MATAAQRFKSTTWSCYIGCLAQGAIMNFAPLFFISLREQFGLSYTQLGTLITANYIAQVAADVIFGRPVDKFGFLPLFTAP
jgi:MFS family permease